ncbi:MAG: LysM peptidoglycan-binding domain-containing protein [Kineosporiaceae bacterium]
MSTLVLRPAAPSRPVARTARPRRPVVRALTVAPVAHTAPVAPLRDAAVTRSPVTTRPRLRLTRRGRVAVRLCVVLLGALATAAIVLAGGRAARAGEDSRPVPAEQVVVQPGETLWQIAGRVAPAADRRDTVARIVELNALPSASLRAGQRIAVPVAP